MTDKKPTIKRITELKNLYLDSDIEVPKIETLRKVQIDPKQYREHKTQATPSKNFWMNTALGRTLSGRNKTGRVVRRVGLGAAGVAGSLLGVDLSFLQEAQGASDLLQILNTLETIAWIISGTILAVTKGVDQIEIQGEKYDEREILEGKVPAMRKLNPKNKR